MSVAPVFMAFVLLLPAGLGLAGEKLIPVSPAQRSALKVATAPLAGQAASGLAGLPAQVVVPPAQERVVAAPVAGLLSEVRVAPGDRVRAGQVLAVLRSEELTSAQRDLAQAAVQARLADETASRDEALYQEGIIPASRLQASKAAREQARAMLGERRSWLRLMGLSGSAIGAAERSERMTDSVALVAPAAGVVVEQHAVVGMRAGSAEVLFKVVRLDPLWLEIQAPVELAARVRPGQPVEVPAVGARGTVLNVGGNVGAAQTVAIRARIGNPDGRLRLNQSVTASLDAASNDKQWWVPVNAVVRQGSRDWLFVQRTGGFEPVPVQVRSRSARSVAIEARFTGDEQIAVTGVAALKAIWQGNGE